MDKKQRFFQRMVKVFALGGLGEIGKNMYCVQYGRELIIIDSGIKFPGNDLLGVDYIIPNIEYIMDNKDKLKGIFLTHGHEDHIGSLPYLLKQIKAPVYGAPLTIGLVRSKLEEHGLAREVDLNVIHERDIIKYNQLSVEFFQTNHSIPDALGVVVRTPVGTIVHTGDFKFDLTPVSQPANIARMAEIGKEGVALLLSDSTNSEKPGSTPSEKTVAMSIREHFQRCEGRILFATFASNVHRLQQVVEAAMDMDRKIVILGRSMERVFQIGRELGHIQMPDELLIQSHELKRYPDNQIVIICTGSQGEPNAALTRIASGSHKHIHVHPEDTIIFSSSPIPGNANNVYRTVDLLLRAGAEVIQGSIMDIHASGHGCEEDLKLMLQLMRPRSFMPIHGEYRMLVQHGKLAERCGVAKDNVFVMDLGDTLQLMKNKARLGKKVKSGEVYVQGRTISELDQTVMEERALLSSEGVIVVIMAIEQETGRLLGEPEFISRGFVYVREADALMRSAQRVVKKRVNQLEAKGRMNAGALRQALVQTLGTYFATRLNRSPLIIPMISEIPVEKLTSSKR